jgi:hypothetical protein
LTHSERKCCNETEHNGDCKGSGRTSLFLARLDVDGPTGILSHRHVIGGIPTADDGAVVLDVHGVQRLVRTGTERLVGGRGIQDLVRRPLTLHQLDPSLTSSIWLEQKIENARVIAHVRMISIEIRCRNIGGKCNF